MSSDIRLAFAHPSARAEATAQDSTPHDRIALRDHVIEADIGAFQVERGARQRLRFNIVLEVRPHPTPLEDDVDRVLSYDTITEAIAAELAAERVNLLETLAERVAERVLAHPQAMRAFVRIEKLDRGPGALGVEIVRLRPADGPRVAPAQPEMANVPRPVVVFLSNAAIAAPGLGGWLDTLERQGLPVILCVGAPEATAPRVAAPLAQRRIDLLAIEQNAWLLAARDGRCIVTDTRTELDWGMKHGQISVWAPSKMVLSAREAPGPGADAPLLARWLADVLMARRVLVIGAGAHPAWQAGTPVAEHLEIEAATAAL